MLFLTRKYNLPKQNAFEEFYAVEKMKELEPYFFVEED